MRVIDEYLALLVVAGQPGTVPTDERFGIPYLRYTRLLRRIVSPGSGQLSQALEALRESDREVLRRPDPALLEVIDPRPLAELAAELIRDHPQARGWAEAETLAAGLTHGGLWFASERSAGAVLVVARELGIPVHIVS